MKTSKFVKEKKKQGIFFLVFFLDIYKIISYSR